MKKIMLRFERQQKQKLCYVYTTYVPGMRYCMFTASSRILSPRKQIAAALNKIALTKDQPTPTQATTYDQSYEISELSFRTQNRVNEKKPGLVPLGLLSLSFTWHDVLDILSLLPHALLAQTGCCYQKQGHCC